MFENSRKTLRKWVAVFAGCWLGGTLAILLLSNLTGLLEPPWLCRIYLWVTFLSSLVTFFVYGWDKRQAKKEKERVREKTLHILAAVGGWSGAMLGQQYFHHKTKKFTFRLLLPIFAVVHMFIVLFLLFIL